MRNTRNLLARICGLPKIGIPKGYVLAVISAASLIAAVGCAQGSYPLDIFYEMHYQPSYKISEPPRLSVPDTAVAWYPPPKNTSFTDDGGHMFQVNCSMCHGATGKGDGAVLQRMMDNYGYVPALPADLTSGPVTAMGRAGVEGFMRSGVVVMPNFSKILNDDEIDLIASYVVNCLQSVDPSAC